MSFKQYATQFRSGVNNVVAKTKQVVASPEFQSGKTKTVNFLGRIADNARANDYSSQFGRGGVVNNLEHVNFSPSHFAPTAQMPPGVHLSTPADLPNINKFVDKKDKQKPTKIINIYI